LLQQPRFFIFLGHRWDSFSYSRKEAGRDRGRVQLEKVVFLPRKTLASHVFIIEWRELSLLQEHGCENSAFNLKNNKIKIILK
jgi:hypothetical protein